MVQYATAPFRYRDRWADQYGDVVRIPGLRRDAYMLAHPDHVRQVLETDHENYGKIDQFSSIFGDGLVALEGEFWQRQRELVQPAFFGDSVANHTGTIVEKAAERADEWSDGDRYDVEREMRELALDILLDVLFGTDFDAGEYDLQKHVRNINAQFLPKNRMVPNWVPTPANRRFGRSIDELHGMIDEQLRARKADHADRDDILSMLVGGAEAAPVEVADGALRDHVVTLLFAGHETSALTLTYTWYLLSENPGVARTLHAELDDVLGDEPPTSDDLDRLEYTEKVIRESMRMYSPAHAVYRQPTTDVEVGDTSIPAGAAVFLPQSVIHRDGRFFDDPDEFRPERWSTGMRRELPKYAYFPFGGGPRRCVGERLGMVEIQLVLATLARRFELELVMDEPLRRSEGLTARPKNSVEAVVRRRAADR